MKYPFALFAVILLSASASVFAQDSTVARYPAAVLVQLRSEHNRMVMMEKNHHERELNEVKRDAAEVMNKMKLDFHDNFRYCPVYYYMDTNAALIKDKKFDGILTDENGAIVRNPVVTGKSTDYVIAYYGYPVSQSRLTDVQTDTSLYSYDPQTPNGIGLVILNDQFLQLTYFYKLGYDELFTGNRAAIKKYTYKSRRFEIEYYPMARLLNDRLVSKDNRRRIKM